MRLPQHENETRTPKKRSDKLADGFSLALSISANRYRLNIGKFDGKICLNVDTFKGKNAVLYYFSIKMPNAEYRDATGEIHKASWRRPRSGRRSSE